MDKLIKVTSNDGDFVEFPSDLTEFCGLVKQENTSQEFFAPVGKQVLEDLKRLIEENNRDLTRFWVKRPIIGADLQQNLDPVSFNVMGRFALGELKLQSDGFGGIDQSKADALYPYLDLAIRWSIPVLLDICLLLIALPYYTDDKSEVVASQRKRLSEKPFNLDAGQLLGIIRKDKYFAKY